MAAVIANLRNTSEVVSYLLLSPDEKINYRAERGLTLQQLIGNTTRIPASDFYDVLKSERYYIRRSSFDNFFGRYYKKPPFMRIRGKFLKSRVYVSVLDAARIASEMRERKEMIEEWPSLEDLNRESGLALSNSCLEIRYREMIRNGKLKVTKVRYNKDGDIVGGRRYVINPEEYQRVLSEERELLIDTKKQVSIPEVAGAMGVTRNRAAELIKIGTGIGLLHPTRVNRKFGGNFYTFMLPKEEAENVIHKRWILPPVRVVERNRKRMSAEQFRVYLETEREMVLARHFWQRTKDGDSSAFKELCELYAPIIRERSSRARINGKSVLGTREKEREQYFYTALFELAQERSLVRRASREQIVRKLEEMVASRISQEVVVNFQDGRRRVSLDSQYGDDGNQCVLDFLGDDGRIVRTRRNIA